MAPAEAHWNMWEHDAIHSGHVCVDCLLPTGIYVKLAIQSDATLGEIKMELWSQARWHPLYSNLQEKSSYIFSCINQQAEHEMLVDETQRLSEVRPFMSVLKVIEHKEAKAERLLNNKIGNIIGKGLHEFDQLHSDEMDDFRWKMREFCENIARSRTMKDELELLWQQFPAELDDSLPRIVAPIRVQIIFGEAQSTFVFQVDSSSMPRQLIQCAIDKRQKLGERLGDAYSFVLRVSGRREYLVRECELWEYKYIYNKTNSSETPQLVMVEMQSLWGNEEEDIYGIEDIVLKPHPPQNVKREQPPSFCLWDITDKFHITVHQILNLNVQRLEDSDSHTTGSSVQLLAGLYHGRESLCENVYSREVHVFNDSAHFNEDIVFDIEIRHLPRITKLCFAVFEVPTGRDRKKRKMEGTPLAWVNTTVMDYLARLRTGSLVIKMWKYPQDTDQEEYLQPLGTVMENSQPEEITELQIKFMRYNDGVTTFPGMDKVLEKAAETAQHFGGIAGHSTTNKKFQKQLRDMCNVSPLVQLAIQEKEYLWSLRHHCTDNVAHALPRLLQCVKWNDLHDAAQMKALLQAWHPLKPEEAMELLDCNYADMCVRQFAVQSMESISDVQLMHYLLQLVQAVKHECYHENDLVEFLLKRALNNMHIGHHFFWLLRSEMHDPTISVRFGAILEAYCRGNIRHMKSLAKQLEAMKKMEALSNMLKSDDNRQKDVRDVNMKSYLAEKSVHETLSEFVCPLLPSYQLKDLNLDKCKSMDSKMRPLMLVFSNQDLYGDDIKIIFKSGDDLRQDMLTLQLIRLMDQIWKLEGLDFRMIPYGCLTTGKNVGLIEVVQEASTIANIQKEYSGVSGAFQKESLYKWLKKHHPLESSLNKAIETFTSSCAGYCVATYVLGIGDRHSDNIMLCKTGQLFHIDFGHILGNVKRFMYNIIKRERAPFVLTHDFVFVITKGRTKRTTEFTWFQQRCEKAFLILRKHSHLLISLFAMMLSTGLPELRKPEDLNYLQETLCLDRSEEEALQHFKTSFNNALKNSWSTSLNWAAHNLKRNNK